MNQRNIFFVWIWLVLGASMATAQVPGYMGRRTAIMANVYGWPGGIKQNFRNPVTYKYDGADVKYLRYDLVASLDRVVSRRHVVGLLLENYRMGSQGYSWRNSRGYIHSGYNRVDVLGSGISLKTFPFLRRGRLAPIGPYFKIDWRVSYVKSTFVPKTTQDTISISYGRLGNSFSMDAGYCGIAGDRVLIDVGLRFSISQFFSLGGFKFYNGYNPTFVDSVNMFKNDLFKFHIGLGFLLGK
jgi:hypothetical protein